MLQAQGRAFGSVDELIAAVRTAHERAERYCLRSAPVMAVPVLKLLALHHKLSI
jgi:hypothetical protein